MASSNAARLERLYREQPVFIQGARTSEPLVEGWYLARMKGWDVGEGPVPVKVRAGETVDDPMTVLLAGIPKAPPIDD